METIAIDTNILVRAIVQDDPKQSVQAQSLIESNNVLILDTVLLEVEWVLRFTYKITKGKIQALFQNLIQTKQIQFEEPQVIQKSVQLYSSGMDFADSLHLAKSHPTPFYTFDKKMLKKSQRTEISVLNP